MRRIRNDIILIVTVIIAIIAGFILYFTLRNDTNLYVNIYSGEELVESDPIWKNKEVTVKGYYTDVIIVIKNNEVYVKESGCNNQICVNTGKISHDGQTITCLPNLVYIKLGKQVNS